ncbi:MAG: hypothetical protein ABIR96_10125 [Bdellovibrionota bacterium]
MRDGLSEPTRNFISKHIDSVEQLEILFLLYRQPAAEWDVKRISQEIRTSATSTQNRLAALLSSGFLAAGPKAGEVLYRYSPASNELHQGVVDLEQEYKIRRVRVIDAIYARPTEKMMNFLDAFKIRKSDKDE